jgi:hypothetical protein
LASAAATDADRHVAGRLGVGGPSPPRAADRDLPATRQLATAAWADPAQLHYCTRSDPGDGFRRYYERAQNEPGWTTHTIDSSHNAQITAPEALAAIIRSILGPKAELGHQPQYREPDVARA